jgi:HlyD family secretion protein
MVQRLQWRRRIVVGVIASALVAGLGYGFYPAPLELDIAAATDGPLRVTIEQEGRTRVIEKYVVAAPVAGYVRRSLLDVGSVIQGGAIVAELEPLRPQALDTRSRAEAEARVRAAASNTHAQRQRQAAAQAESALAQQELARVRVLRDAGYATQADLDRAAWNAERSRALLQTAALAVSTATHELAAARAALMYAAAPGPGGAIAIRAPVAGRVLKIQHKSEGPVAAGETLLEIGDPYALEVEVDLLSADAVRVHVGTPVLFERWGGDVPLQGEVKRIEPAGFTKVSALGVEEQRVWVIVAFTSPRALWQRLGDGYRVEASFLVWEGREVLQLPASALFRHAQQWAAYVVQAGRVRIRYVRPGASNGLQTQILAGIAAGERVVAHPDERVREGVRVTSRQ